MGKREAKKRSTEAFWPPNEIYPNFDYLASIYIEDDEAYDESSAFFL